MSDKTNDFIIINDIHDSLLFLKDGSVAAVLETSAVNFDLLSANEQLAIISSFAGLLNSLSFPIQIVIRSKKLDISSYISKLLLAEAKQTSPLMKQMMSNYRNFISEIINDNEVLDKQFLVVIPVNTIELGLLSSASSNMNKVLAAVMPRIDQISKQLSRVGLKTTLLDDEQLIKLFYEEYNEELLTQQSGSPIPQPVGQIAVQPMPPIPPPILQPVTQQIAQPVSQAPAAAPPVNARRPTPFVVEELSDDYGVVI